MLYDVNEPRIAMFISFRKLDDETLFSAVVLSVSVISRRWVETFPDFLARLCDDVLDFAGIL